MLASTQRIIEPTLPAQNALRAPSPNGSASASVAPTPSVAIRPLSKTTPAGERRAWPEDQALKTAIVQALRPSQRDWGVLDVEGIRASDLALAPEDVMRERARLTAAGGEERSVGCPAGLTGGPLPPAQRAR